MTGGNTFIPDLVAQLYPDEINPAALDAGKQRALFMLQNAASMELAVTGTTATVKVTNNTGHKLPSGYPEGRRMWINLQAYDATGALLYESGAYDSQTAVLEKEGTKIYEIKLGISDELSGIVGLPPGESFHFVLNNQVEKDNRIPPLGFTNANFEAIGSPVVAYTYPDGQNWDNTSYSFPTTPTYVKAQLLYQTVSKEYVEFLQAENTTNDAGNMLYRLWDANGRSAPVVMQEAEWGNSPGPTLDPIYAEIQSLTRLSAKGSKVYVTASVLISDQNGTVAGADVSGVFTGPTSSSVSGTTDASGMVEFSSRSTRNPVGEWCLDITSVTKEGYEYPPTGQVCESKLKSTSLIAAPEAGVNIYPNPFTDQVFFEISRPMDDHVRIELFDLNGKLIRFVADQEIKAQLNYTFNYATGNLVEGMLIYRITFNTETITGKLIRE